MCQKKVNAFFDVILLRSDQSSRSNRFYCVFACSVHHIFPQKIAVVRDGRSERFILVRMHSKMTLSWIFLARARTYHRIKTKMLQKFKIALFDWVVFTFSSSFVFIISTNRPKYETHFICANLAKSVI